MDQDRPTLTIKLKPYLQEYLTSSLGDPLMAKNNFISVMLRPLIELRPVDVKPFSPKSSEYITIFLPNYQDLNTRNNTVYMSEDNQKTFEKILMSHFDSIFFSYMDDKIRYMNPGAKRKLGFKKCILQFCYDHNMSFNHLTYDMLWKKFQRRKLDSRKPNIFSKSLSISCPLFFLL